MSQRLSHLEFGRDYSFGYGIHKQNDGDTIAHVPIRGSEGSQEAAETEAYARLFAVAPELLAAAEAVDQYTMFVGSGSDEECNARDLRLRAAIAKAQGRP